MSRAFIKENKGIDTKDKTLEDHTNVWYSLTRRRKNKKQVIILRISNWNGCTLRTGTLLAREKITTRETKI